MTNIGILVNNLGLNDLALSLIENMNKLCGTVNVTCFVQKRGPYPKSPLFSILNANEALSYRWPLIATDAETARLLSNNFSSCKKIHYLWDLNWYRDSATLYNSNKELFTRPDIAIACRSLDHQAIFKRVWGRESYLIEDFNYETIRGISQEV